MLSPIQIPYSVPKSEYARYVDAYQRMTEGTGRLFLFAGDQKVEHLNKDFFGENIAPETAHPEHLFRIASQSRIGCFATQLGLIARYAGQYPSIPYLVKMNSKTDLVPTAQRDPLSRQLVSIADVVRMRDEHGVMIVGVGYTIYLGSEYEFEMLREAAQLVMDAHRNGMLVVLWVYPRGKAVGQERSVDIIAGAAGVAHCLGADFVKVNPPQSGRSESSEKLLQQVVAAAGNTGVLCAGGASQTAHDFLQGLHKQLVEGGIAGAAIGRNVHQKSLLEAIAFCNAVAKIIYDGASVQEG